jgi:glucokinase
VEECYLAGDIGGTKTRLALFSPAAVPRRPLERDSYLSQEFPSLEEIVRLFLGDKQCRLTGASFGVAGPIMAGRAKVTNLSWVVDAASLSQAIGGIKVNLINDLHSIASAIPYLKPDELELLIPGKPDPHGAIGVIAPGTGLGEGFLVWDGEKYQPCPSEGGHASFGPQTSLQLELLNYLDDFFGHVSYERVCSGMGIINLYNFLREAKGMPAPGWLDEQLQEVKDPTPVIAKAALENKSEICSETMGLFVSILGSEAGNLALKVLATGGIYLGGGIPRRILPLLRGENFHTAFTDKGRFTRMLHDVPVYVITHPYVGVFGAACYGFLRMNGAQPA